MKNTLGAFKRVRAFCLDCCGDSPKEVRYCARTDCPLWPLRFGSSPKAAIRRMGEHGKELFDEKKFQEGEKFSPGESVSEMEP